MIAYNMIAMTLSAKRYGRHIVPMISHSLIEAQISSYQRFQNQLLAELFAEFSPFVSYDQRFALYFPDNSPQAKAYGLTYWFDECKHSVSECFNKRLTYSMPLYVKVALHDRQTDEHRVETLFFGEVPAMTSGGSFIINGVERVVVSQIIRSPGAYFFAEEDPNTKRVLGRAMILPERGTILEIETRRSGYLVLRVAQRRSVPATLLLRALPALTDNYDDSVIGDQDITDEGLVALFADIPEAEEYIRNTIDQEPSLEAKQRTLAQEALVELMRRLRPGDPPTLDNARNYFNDILFSRFDFDRHGRHKINQRLELNIPLSRRALTKRDILATYRRLLLTNAGLYGGDELDNLGNRRVRTVGELLQARLRVAMRRMEGLFRERCSMLGTEEKATPLNLINIRPFTGGIREFFVSSFVQLLEQVNPLSELTTKRTLTAMGPGGLRRERAGFEARDVHHSHYGRICPIETPEGPNIGLVIRLATYARVNELGFIETPYYRVKDTAPNRVENLVGRTAREDIVDDQGVVVVHEGAVIDENIAKRLSKLPLSEVPVAPYVSDEVVYMTADEEEQFVIAQARTERKPNGELIAQQRIPARLRRKFIFVGPKEVQFIDYAPSQIVGISASMIPFIEHDEASRALMGSNMQRQGVPLIHPEAPIVATGVETLAARESGALVIAEEDGQVTSVTGDAVHVKTSKGVRKYVLRRFQRSNQSTCIDQRPVVQRGQRVHKGQVLAESMSAQDGMLALGRNVLVAFLSWEGGNYEDAVVVSERLVRDDVYTSVHIDTYECEARHTRVGDESITRDIPNVSEDMLRNLDISGVARIGAPVRHGDILVGRVTPKARTDITPEERLLRAIFGESAREVKDTSLRLPHGESGVVIGSELYTREEYPEMTAGVHTVARIHVAQMRPLTVGDKMAGRHGNKGVVSQIVPIEDMPFLEDGTPIDIILNPLGVPSRMNIGQILETHLGWAAFRLGFRAITPVFDGARENQIEAELCRAWLMDTAWREVTERAWQYLKEKEYPLMQIKDEHEARLLFMDEWLKDQRDYDRDRAQQDETYARRIALCQWLKEKGYDPSIMVYENDPRSLEAQTEADAEAFNAALQLWSEQQTGQRPNLTGEALRAHVSAISLRTGNPPPHLGQMKLYDGKTGEPFDRPVTVGVMYVMKLIHMVDDKIHARSTGQYSLITQQPLGGRANFGGQRVGEMEVWALEAYGAAHNLREMLTIKSDDVNGRTAAYHAIIRGEDVPSSEAPATFDVLVRELQGLCLSVEAVDDQGNRHTFGREMQSSAPPQLGGLGLLDVDENR